MQYDFDQIVDRSQNHAAKYDERAKKFGTADVIPLWIADMDFKTAQPIIDALSARAQEGIWGYTARPDSYFEAIRSWQKRRHGWDIDPDLMSFSPGVVQSISAMVKLFTPEGGSVLIQTPVYSEFYDMTEAWGRRVVESPFAERAGRWCVDWADFEAKLEQSDLFLLCSPHNPLGIVWTPEELERMARLCMKHHVVLFSDEIHSDLVFHGKRHTPVAALSPEIARFAVTGISGTKTFNLAGLSFSDIIIRSHEERKRFIRRDKTHGAINPLSVAAHKAAYEQAGEWLDELKLYLDGNLKFVKDFISENIPTAVFQVPDATYFAWVDFRKTLPDVKDLSLFFANNAGVLLEGGDALFVGNAEGFVRLNLAMPRALVKEGLERMAAAIERYSPGTDKK